MNKVIITRANNLLNCITHESKDGRELWTYHEVADGQHLWHVTDEIPEKAGIDSKQRLHVRVKVKETFTDAESLIHAQRENGYHNWKE